MRIRVAHTIIFILTFFLLSCSSVREKHRLSVDLPEDFHYDIIEKVYLTEGENLVEGRENYDTVTKMLSYVYDSIPNGNYVLHIKTIFDQPLISPIALSSDSTFRVIDPYGKSEFISKEELSAADTIEFVFISQGCFHHYFEKSILVRTKDTYYLKTSSNTVMLGVAPLRIQKTVSKGIVDSLFVLESDLKKEKEASGTNGMYYFSTTTKYLFFKCGNRVFMIQEPSREDDGFYDRFKSAYILTNTDTLQ